MTDLGVFAVPVARGIVTVVLGSLALLHTGWAFGLWWPARDEDHLVRAVVGARGAARMPGAIPCLVIAAGLTVAAVLPWLPQDGTLGEWYRIGMGVFAAIFALRALIVLLPAWRRATARDPFARLDPRLYAPVSALLALAFGILATV